MIILGNLPKDEHINFRTQSSVKHRAKQLPCTMEDIFKIGLKHASSEIDCLMYRKDELELCKAKLEEKLSQVNKEIVAINNRIRYIAPSKLDKETLNSMINQATMEYAEKVFDTYGEDSLDRFSADDVLDTAKDWGYDGEKFLELVGVHLKRLM